MSYLTTEATTKLATARSPTRGLAATTAEAGSTTHAFSVRTSTLATTKAATAVTTHTSMLASLGVERLKLGSLLGCQDAEDGDPRPNRVFEHDLSSGVSASVEGLVGRLVCLA